MAEERAIILNTEMEQLVLSPACSNAVLLLRQSPSGLKLWSSEGNHSLHTGRESASAQMKLKDAEERFNLRVGCLLLRVSVR